MCEIKSLELADLQPVKTTKAARLGSNCQWTMHHEPAFHFGLVRFCNFTLFQLLQLISTLSGWFPCRQCFSQMSDIKNRFLLEGHKQHSLLLDGH